MRGAVTRAGDDYICSMYIGCV